MTRINKLMRLPAIVFVWVALLAASTPLYAQSRYDVTTSTDGTSSGRLVQASNGNLYGVTYNGGEHGFGTVFRMTPDGVLTTLDSFTPEMGAPAVGSGLVQDRDGDLYGTTEGGATFGGTVFRFTLSDGKISTWAAFDVVANGSTPSGRLIEAKDGYLYGTAIAGPEDADGNSSLGLVFRVNRAKATTDANGTIETVVTFPNDGSAGEAPSAGVVQAPDESFYGTAEFGGDNFAGTIFRVANGAVSAVHSFNGTDGANPASKLLVRGDYLYGTAMAGGANAGGSLGDGTLFELSLMTHELRTLGSFDFANGSFPYQQGVIDVAGYLYGTTMAGGEFGMGTIYRWSEGTGIQLLHSTGSTGESPDSTLILAKDGTIYGTAIVGEGGVIIRILSDAALTVAPVRASLGGRANLSATLNVLDAPKANATISFSINGVNLGSALTNTAGVATLNVSVAGLPVGSQPGAITASFASAEGILPTSARGDLTIEFLDATPPTIKVPANMTVNATSPAGATVTFAVTATDNSGTATIACTPASGSLFKIGVTTVNCTATDLAGNIARGTFKVKVLSAAEQIVDLVEKLRGMSLNSLVKKILTVVLQAAIANPKHAPFVCSVLESFISNVTKHAGSNPTLANALIADARRIQAVIGCR